MHIKSVLLLKVKHIYSPFGYEYILLVFNFTVVASYNFNSDFTW